MLNMFPALNQHKAEMSNDCVNLQKRGEKTCWDQPKPLVLNSSGPGGPASGMGSGCELGHLEL